MRFTPVKRLTARLKLPLATNKQACACASSNPIAFKFSSSSLYGNVSSLTPVTSSGLSFGLSFIFVCFGCTSVAFGSDFVGLDSVTFFGSVFADFAFVSSSGFGASCVGDSSNDFLGVIREAP